MSYFGNIWNGIVQRWYITDDEPADWEEEPSPRQKSAYAAPSSVYQSPRAAGSPFAAGSAFKRADTGLPYARAESSLYTGLRSFAEPRDALGPNASVLQFDGLGRNGSVVPCSSQMLNRSVFDINKALSPAPMPDIHIPFKDGSSQILLRPKFGPQGLETPDPQMNLVGASFLRSSAYMARDAQFFISDPEDIVDVQVAEYFKANPDMYLKTRLTRIRPGIYSTFGREIEVEWREPSGSLFMESEGELWVKDGDLQHPFADYLGGSICSTAPSKDMNSNNGTFNSNQARSMDRPLTVSARAPVAHQSASWAPAIDVTLGKDSNSGARRQLQTLQASPASLTLTPNPRQPEARNPRLSLSLGGVGGVPQTSRVAGQQPPMRMASTASLRQQASSASIRQSMPMPASIRMSTGNLNAPQSPTSWQPPRQLINS